MRKEGSGDSCTVFVFSGGICKGPIGCEMSHDAFVLSTASALSMQSLARVRVEMEELVNEAALEMGYSSIRDKQKEAILGFLSGRDVFVSLPTGSGKSLCYSILPKVFDRVRKRSGSIVIVVSPLVSLMKDQVHSLETKGIKSVFVTKDTAKDSESDDSSFEQQLYEGSFQVVFFSPEALLCNDTWRELLQTSVYQKNVVIDEAHLVKKW